MSSETVFCFFLCLIVCASYAVCRFVMFLTRADAVKAIRRRGDEARSAADENGDEG